MKQQMFVTVVFFIFGMVAYSQPDVMKREYGYDAVGNRVVRKVVDLSNSSSSSSSSSPKQKSMDNATENGEDEDFLVDNLGDITLKVFPNPTTSMVNIQIENVDVIHQGIINVYNAAGTQLGTQTITSLNASIDLSIYPPGIYLVNITINKKETKWKVIKE